MSGEPGPSTEETLRERVQRLPAEPGVYLFRDARGQVLYVGKAQSLRGRVRSYFSRGGDGRHRMHFLVPRIVDVEVVVTANVKEALLLENQLIKKHRPRFNVRLRDDKAYLALRLDPRGRYPRFTQTRRFLNDGATYFGPYTSSASLHDTLNVLQKLFPLRTCSDSGLESYRRKGRPCLEHAIGRCAAPCCHKVSDEDYGELARGAVLFLKGKSQDLLRELRARMKEAAEEERFEEAARLRDRLLAVERTVERQVMISTHFVDRDVFALAREAGRVEVQILHVRQGKLLGNSTQSFREVRLDDAEVLSSLLGQFYEGDRGLPREVLVPLEVEGSEALEELWRERAGHVVRIHVPKRGERHRLVQMAARNAELALLERSRREQTHLEALEALATSLRLPAPPRRIECYDLSHLGGVLHVGSRVLFIDGSPHKDGYRRYKIREAEPGDDYAGMREVLRRRLRRLDQDPAPDLLLLDGGKGQLNAVRAVLEDEGRPDIPLAAISKERDGDRVVRHGGLKRERVFLPGVKDPITLHSDSPALLLLQRVRDESHRFAIQYHKSLRSKRALRSVLDELPGIGPVKRQALLRGLGSLQRIREASESEIAAVEKITRSDAELIYRFFHAAKDAPEGSGPSNGE
ncbi:MAG: excinuclease ABC subunit UvrC [Myxococcota bacterium]